MGREDWVFAAVVAGAIMGACLVFWGVLAGVQWVIRKLKGEE